MDSVRIMQMIPHRPPFLMIDQVRDLRAGEGAVGIKNVTMTEPHFQGHFPGAPVMPGVLIVEAMAQTAAVLVVHTLGPDAEGKIVYFMSVDNCRFRRPVFPGDQIIIEVNKQRHTRPGVAVRGYRQGRRQGRGGGCVRSDVPGRQMSRIHSTAVIAGGARIAEDAEIGAYCCVGEGAVIEAGVVLHPHVVVTGRTRIGSGTVVYPFASLGQPPQFVGFNRQSSGLDIGSNNVLREYVTMNEGTDTGGVPDPGGKQRLFHGRRPYRP